MRLTAKLTFLVFVLICASGACMSISLNPFKKEVVLMSPLKGILLKAGLPLPNVEVEVVIVMPDGEKRIYSHLTDSSGVFDLPVLKDQMTLGPMTEFAVSQFVNVKFEGEEDNIWYAAKREPGLYAERYPPGETLGLTCELNDEVESYREQVGFINTKCKWTEIRRV